MNSMEWLERRTAEEIERFLRGTHVTLVHFLRTAVRQRRMSGDGRTSDALVGAEEPERGDADDSSGPL